MTLDPTASVDLGVANVSRFLDAMARDSGGRCALRIPRGQDRESRIQYLDLSFAELSAEQDAWVLRLKENGVARGSRALLMVRPGLPLIAICFALFKMGAVPVVSDPGMGLRSFLACVRRSTPEHLVGIPLAIWIARLFRGSFSSLKGCVSAPGPATRINNGKARNPLLAEMTRSDELAAILFTSGSTGPPKGVCYEHGMFEAQVEAIRRHYEIEPGEIDLPMLPIFALFNPALGMTTVVPEIDPSRPARADPAKIVQAIQQCGVTNSFGSPVLWRKVADHCETHGVRLPSLRRILMAGASAPVELVQRYRSILGEGHVHSPYGATEILPVSSIEDHSILTEADGTYDRGTCVGKPLPGVSVRILPVLDRALEGDDLCRTCQQGEIGEIVVSGPSVTKKYDRLPEATAAAKVIEGGRVWHRMGDLGYLDECGRIWFCGRKVERVEVNGHVRYTDCCEGIFNRVEGVRRSALIVLKQGGECRPAVAIEPEKGCFPASAGAERSFVARLIEEGKSSAQTSDISHFRFCRAFPVDVRHNAKINRLALARRFSR